MHICIHTFSEFHLVLAGGNSWLMLIRTLLELRLLEFLNLLVATRVGSDTWKEKSKGMN